MLLQYVTDAHRDALHLREGHAGLRIEVDAQLIGMIEVPAADRPRIEVDAAEVHRPDEMGEVGRAQLLGRPAARERDGRRLQPLRSGLGHPLLEEEVALRAVREAFEDRGTQVHPTQRTGADRQVVLDQVQLRLAPRRDRNALEKWRLLDYINEIKVLTNGSTVEKSMTGRMAHYLNWADGGPAILDQHQNYGTSTNRVHGVLNFGRYFKDEEFGLDLGRYDSVELQITNDAAVGIYSAFATPSIYGIFLKDAPSGIFKGHTRTEEYRKWTTVQAAVEYLRLQEEGRLRKIVFQVDSAVSAAMVPDTTLYNVLYNLRITHKAKSTELFNGNLRDLWYLNAYEDGRDLFQGMEPYNTDGYGFRTGLGQTLAKAANHHEPRRDPIDVQRRYDAGEDSSALTRQADSDNDHTR